ncbi:YggT family protein [Vagococcus silagei]|uniref:YggT family protein n=1 Tax=Vagococcus silagei TaxID=2508885 RepID=A0A4S3B1P7_9ENTE|nr:YggT family protein [Vagococcus silagei]
MLSLFLYIVRIYSFVLIAYALLSWFPGAYQTKIGEWIINLSRPYLSLFDRLNLSFGPIDFTIIVAIFALNIFSEVISKILIGLLY